MSQTCTNESDLLLNTKEQIEESLKRIREYKSMMLNTSQHFSKDGYSDYHLVDYIMQHQNNDIIIVLESVITDEIKCLLKIVIDFLIENVGGNSTITVIVLDSSNNRLFYSKKFNSHQEFTDIMDITNSLTLCENLMNGEVTFDIIHKVTYDCSNQRIYIHFNSSKLVVTPYDIY